MPRNPLRVLTAAGLAANLVAAAVALALWFGRQPSGPGDTKGDLYDCLTFLLVALFLVLASYSLCVRKCEDKGDLKDRCYLDCLRQFLYAEFAVIVLFFACVVAAVWF